MERLSITFTSNDKREFVPRDQVSPRLLFIISTHKLVISRNFFIQLGTRNHYRVQMQSVYVRIASLWLTLRTQKHYRYQKQIVYRETND